MTPTPGPWIVTDNFGEGKRLHMVWAHGQLLARTCCEPDSEANARLIAAAPVLLEALTDVARMIEMGWIPPDNLDEYTAEGVWQFACRAFRDSVAYAAARAAITKAETPVTPKEPA